MEQIADVVLQHARKIDPGFQMAIVGGYRRGNETVSDVDVVLSHLDENATINVVESIVSGLEDDGYITHTLSLSLQNSERSQVAVSWKGEGGDGGGGVGFDTLDKAIVVWQDRPARRGARHGAAAPTR